MSFAVLRGEPTKCQLWLDKHLDAIVKSTGREEDRYSLSQIIFHFLRLNPSYVNSIECSSGEKMLNSELLDKSVRTARALRAAGVGKGDVVMIIATRHNLTIVPHYACLFIGAVAFHIDDGSKKAEILNYLRLSNPKYVFADSNLLDTVDEAIKEYNDGPSPPVTSLEADHKCNRKDLANFICNIEADVANFKLVDVSRQDLALLVCTSGSTGLPKAISLTNYGIIANISLWRCNTNTLELNPDDRMFIASSIQWFSFVYYSIVTTVYGIQQLQSRLPSTPEHILEIFRKYRPEITMLGPGTLNELFNSPGYKHGDLACLKTIFSGGAFVSADLQLRTKKEIHPEGILSVGNGCSEMAGFLNIQTPDSSVYSIGKEVNTVEYKIVDDNYQELPLGTIGEMLARGKEPFSLGYYKDEETTKMSYLPGGWFKTGDLVYKKENGEYYYVERKKCLIKYGSYHIYPVEVENAIGELEGVSGVGVCWSDRGLAALVQTAPGGKVTEEQVKDHVKSKLSHYKVPSCVYFAPLPTTVSGKLNRTGLANAVAKLIKEQNDN